MLQQLLERGEDLSQPRHVIYFFYGSDVETLRQPLSALGFESHSSESEDYWAIDQRHIAMQEAGHDISWSTETPCLSAERTEVIGEEWRTSTLRDMCKLGESHNVVMNGWQASQEIAGD